MKKDVTFNPGRRQVLVAGLTGAAALAVAPYIHAADRSVKVGVYGGFFKDSFDEHIFPEFTKATGIKVESVSEPTGEAWLVQLRNAARAGQAPADVSMMAQVPRIKGERAELWLPLDESRLPNSEYLRENFIHRYPDNRVSGVGAVSWYITLVTNTEAFPQAPDSWKTLWDPANKDKAGLLALPSNSFLLEVTAKTFFGGEDMLKDKESVTKVMEKLAELSPNVRLWYRDEAQFQRELQSGEIPLGEYYHDVTQLAVQKGEPVRSTFPKEGGVLDSGSWVISKASKKIDESQVFINYMCQPEIQDVVARTLGSAPTVKREHLDLSDDEFAQVSSEIPPILPQYDLYVDLGDWISDEWTRVVLR